METSLQQETEALLEMAHYRNFIEQELYHRESKEVWFNLTVVVGEFQPISLRVLETLQRAHLGKGFVIAVVTQPDPLTPALLRELRSVDAVLDADPKMLSTLLACIAATRVLTDQGEVMRSR